MTKRSPFHILGVSRNATDEEIVRSYRRLRSLSHPDKYRGEGSHVLFEEIQKAYEAIRDSKDREKLLLEEKRSVVVDPYETARQCLEEYILVACRKGTGEKK